MGLDFVDLKATCCNENVKKKVIYILNVKLMLFCTIINLDDSAKLVKFVHFQDVLKKWDAHSHLWVSTSLI